MNDGRDVALHQRGSDVALWPQFPVRRKRRKTNKQKEQKMKLKTKIAVITGITLAVAASTLSVWSGPGENHPPKIEGVHRTIQGAWRTVITGVDCQTGVPLGTPFPGLFTFNEGGTMSEYGIGPGSNPALRSPGHGVWQREHGWQNYSYAFTYYRYNSSGVFIGSQKVSSTLELGASGDEFISRSAVSVLDANGNVIATFCATAAGTRFE
jgi:hypothetical protein